MPVDIGMRDERREAPVQIDRTEPCPEIRWDEVVRVDAMGHDAIGPFEVCVNFTHSDGSSVAVYVHTRGYYELVTTLHKRFPTISPTWYAEMMANPDWHVEQRLYSRES